MVKLSSVEHNEKALSLLKAAASVFLAHGFSAATTDMIQRKASISKATMYALFPNKEALFAAVIEHECAQMTKSFMAIKVSRGNIAKTLTDLGMSFLNIVLSPTALALHRVVLMEAPRFPNLGRRFYLAGPKVLKSMVTMRLSEAVQAGEIDVLLIGVESASTIFMSMVRAEAQLECLTHPDSKPSAAQKDHWVRLAVTSFLEAFGTPPRRSTPICN